MVYKLYKWYILPIGGLYATYHLLGEPETTIEIKIAGGLMEKTQDVSLKGGENGPVQTFPTI